jgi:microcystin-dependent protein
LQSLGEPVPGLHASSATAADEAAALTDAGGTAHTYEELAGAEDAVPAGAVMYFAMNTCPAGWIPADGQIASRSSFPDLYAAIGDTYGAGDGSTTFGKPDLRGEFLRGWDNSRGTDVGRVLGSTQGSATRVLANAYFSSGGTAVGNSTHGLIGHDPGVQWVGVDFVTAGAGSFTTKRSMAPIMDSNYGNAAETRPRNVAMLACIKY